MFEPVYQTERVTVYHGDCLEVMPQLEAGSVDAVVTDPPYGISHSSHHGASWQDTTIHGDSDPYIRNQALKLWLAVPQAVFGTWKTPPIEGVRGVLVWDKGPAFGMGDLAFPWKPSWELIYIAGDGWNGRRDEGVLRGDICVSWESRGRKHPHQKPVGLLRRILAKLPKGMKIIDPFAGTGTTGVATLREGMRCTLIEIEQRYIDIIIRRLEAEEAQGRLF